MLTLKDIITGALENKELEHLNFQHFVRESYDKVEECWYLEEEEWTLDESGCSIYTHEEQQKIIQNLIALDEEEDMENLAKVIELTASMIEVTWNPKWDIEL